MALAVKIQPLVSEILDQPELLFQKISFPGPKQLWLLQLQ